MTTARWDEDVALTCVGCSDDVEDWDLCAHDDGPGAVCPTCCRHWHPDEVTV